MNISKLFVIAVMLSALIACGGAEERKSSYMDKAQQALESGDFEKARINAKNVLQIDPKDAEGHYLLGTIFERMQEYRKAFGNYNKATELAPEIPKYQAKIGKFYLVLANDSEKAREKLELIRSIDKDNIDGLLLEAGILASEKKIDEAKAVSKKLMQVEPGNIENAILMSTMLMSEKDYDEALKVLDTAEANNDGGANATLMVSRLQVLVAMGDDDRTVDVIKKLREIQPDNYQYDLTLARFYSSKDDHAAAKAVLREAIQKNDEVIRRIELINYVENRESIPAAIEESNTQISEAEETGLLKIKLAQLLSKNKNEAEAEKVLKEVADGSNQDAIKAKLLLAEIYMSRKDVDAAVKVVDEAFEQAPNDADVNMLRARIELANGNVEQGIISLRTVIKDSPENLDAYVLLARAHAANNEVDQAEDILARAHENNRGNLDNLLKLSKMHFQSKRYDQADRVIDDYIRINQSSYDAYVIKAAVHNVRKEYAQASELADRLRTLDPTKSDGYIQAAPALVQENKVKEVIALLEDGLQKTNYHDGILSMLIRAKVSQANLDAAIAYLEEAIKNNPSESKYQLYTKLYADNKRLDDAMNIVDRGLTAFPRSASMHIAKSQLYRAKGMIRKSIETLEAARDKVDDQTPVLMELAGRYEQAEQYSAAIKTYRKLREKDSANPIYKNNLAAILVDKNILTEGDIDEALSLVKDLESNQNAAVRDTVAWVNYHAGNYTKAASILKELVEAEPENAIFNYHYGMTLIKTGDDEAAKKHLGVASSGKQSRYAEKANKALKEIGG